MEITSGNHNRGMLQICLFPRKPYIFIRIPGLILQEHSLRRNASFQQIICHSPGLRDLLPGSLPSGKDHSCIRILRQIVIGHVQTPGEIVGGLPSPDLRSQNNEVVGPGVRPLYAVSNTDSFRD